jgi:hypothetical protein
MSRSHSGDPCDVHELVEISRIFVSLVSCCVVSAKSSPQELTKESTYEMMMMINQIYTLTSRLIGIGEEAICCSSNVMKAPVLLDPAVLGEVLPLSAITIPILKIQSLCPSNILQSVFDTLCISK